MAERLRRMTQALASTPRVVSTYYPCVRFHMTKVSWVRIPLLSISPSFRMYSFSRQFLFCTRARKISIHSMTVCLLVLLRVRTLSIFPVATLHGGLLFTFGYNDPMSYVFQEPCFLYNPECLLRCRYCQQTGRAISWSHQLYSAARLRTVQCLHICDWRSIHAVVLPTASDKRPF